MNISVTYWRDGEPKELSGAWDDLPREGVLWVTLEHKGYTHTLLCQDYYWVEGDMYGTIADPNLNGRGYSAWQWARVGARYLGALPPPADARLLEGIWVPDDTWNSLRGQDG